jgi:TRAP-type C4-dicarboxylate transport system permease small subunit
MTAEKTIAVEKLKWLQKAEQTLAFITGGMLLISAVVGFMAVIARYVLHASLSWSFEVLRILLIYMTFTGSYLALRQRMHIGIDFVVKKMPIRVQTIFFVFTKLIIACVAGTMIYYGFWQAFLFPGQVTDILRIPVGAIYIIIPLSGIGMLIHTICSLIEGIRRSISGMAPEGAVSP